LEEKHIQLEDEINLLDYLIILAKPNRKSFSTLLDCKDDI